MSANLGYLYSLNYLYNYRFLNKFYFINTKQLPFIDNLVFELHNVKNEKDYIEMFAFMDEFAGLVPMLKNKGFYYSNLGKKIYINDLKVSLYAQSPIFHLLKTIYFNLFRKYRRVSIVSGFNANRLVLHIRLSDLKLSFVRDLYTHISPITLKFYFNCHNKILNSYFFKIFGFI